MKNLFMTMIIFLPALTFAEGAVQLQTSAQKEEVVLNEKGETESRLVPVTTVVPGDQVIYTITFSNKGDTEAEAVTITDPVPEQMRYVDGSAFGGGTDILFSVDGGKSFGAPDTLIVVDAVGGERPARAEDYTHIRWTMRSPLPPGKQGHARFKAELR
ncbi:MAG: hypothetical protein OER80_00925 [Gammaproteobacteria bacterium]|nr:hypothetical protein [Gammaproteobacteria bacterium]MDH3768291.1 hypothetical protein [Gammaproteobacteria bacterium]